MRRSFLVLKTQTNRELKSNCWLNSLYSMRFNRIHAMKYAIKAISPENLEYFQPSPDQ